MSAIPYIHLLSLLIVPPVTATSACFIDVKCPLRTVGHIIYNHLRLSQ